MQKLDIKTGKILQKEVRDSISELKNNKTTGINDIQTEMVKYCGKAMEKQLLQLFNKIWANKKKPHQTKQ